MQQVWLFILAPLVGAGIAVVVWMFTRTQEEMPEGQVAGSVREEA